MLRRPLFVVGCLFLVALFCGLQPSSSAANGRGFSGFYTVSGASQAGPNYTITFSAALFNHSGATVTDATVWLRGCPPVNSTCTVFQHVNIDAVRWTRLNTQVTIPASLADRWEKGGRPELMIEFTDAAGEKQVERIDLAPDRSGTRTVEQ